MTLVDQLDRDGFAVVPGVLEPASVEALAIAASTAARLGKRLCAVNAGDALLFRPLTLHASRKAVVESARRVIHLEFANVTLPAPLSWAESV